MDTLKRPFTQYFKFFSAILLSSLLPFNVQAACPNINCTNFSDATWTYIQNTYCNNPCVANTNSAFDSAHCASKQTMIDLCNALIADTSCSETPLRGGRILGSATLTNDLGNLASNNCSATKKGSMLYNSVVNQVTTIFPGP
ncbi:hypothetical protein KCM76_21325 [Zooshikella marina]|uniref:hypothetical protein n=1 Tax=Zooshikella ganghwensis TaxID=202772 RepID=UPI001BAF3528|nr:hypothetical protein [Zooshikella ganghwensis]MBU2708549.1 hypothetical protein [Zooshikella ganghwensis]